jgi:hypothetical protein
VRHLGVGLLLLVSLLSQGCLCMLVCPESFGDMRLQADDLDLPSDFVLVTEELSGMRSSFMAAPPPEVNRQYAAPWDDGKLCDRIADLTGSASLWRTQEEGFRRQSGACGFETRIGAGWKAWPVNNWTYKLFVTAIPPETRFQPGEARSEAECVEIRERYEEQKAGRAGVGRAQTSWAAAWCWVPPGHALVSVTIRAGQNWFRPAE